MKYIDAEKLKAEIERLGRNWDGTQELQPASLFQADLYELLSIIDSLQQEQPEVEFEDKFAKFIEKKDAELGANTWSEEDLRELALYFYYSRNEDKQREVDLEKEIEEYFPESYFENAINFDNAIDIARHFYELGKNSK